MSHSLESTPLIKMLASNAKVMEKVARTSGLPRGPVRAEVVDVDDPQERGRVRVLFDAVNFEKIPQVEGAGIYSQSREGREKYYSHWIDTSPAFKGKQPPGLVGKRVSVILSNSEYPYAILQDVLHDKELLTDEASNELKIPNNSSMTRLPIYPAGSLPPPDEVNIGCTVIEEGGPMNSDWLCVCLKRNGKHIWVRHGDLAHGHAGGNDITSQVTASGERTSPGYVASIYDHVFVTSDKEMIKCSGYFTGPSGNPWGEAAGWSPPPMDVFTKPLKYTTGPLLNQNSALSYARNSGYINKIAGAFTSGHAPSISAAVEMVPGFNFAKKLLEKGQKALEVAIAVKKAVDNPTGFVSQVATSAINSYSPPTTKSVIEGISNPGGFIATTYSGLKSALGSALGIS